MFEFLKPSKKNHRPIHPHPLIFPEKKLSLFFSAKAGCTFATKWFFYQMGILDEALAYDPFVHQYRMDVYNKSDIYKQEIMQVNSPDYTRIKLVRSPYQRAVSSYIHAILHNHVDAEISDFLARQLSDARRFSFEEFIAYLEFTGVKNCNPHHRLQTLPEERKNILSFTLVIKLEESLQKFRLLEKDLGLKTSNLEEFAQSFHHREKMPSASFNGDKILGRLNKRYFDYESFYNEPLKQRVANLYACDFSQYHYNTDEF